jgi:hypothetical protein
MTIALTCFLGAVGIDYLVEREARIEREVRNGRGGSAILLKKFGLQER